MPQQKKRAAARRSEPKVFRCTGFGDCDMVFTRSEHLARHARKHTGEKPFKCVVPSCNRMFSRFDNMMQHTHTHNKRTSTTKKTEQKKYYSSRSSTSSSVPSSPNTPNNEQNIYVEQKTILPHSDNNNYYYHHYYYHHQPAPQQNYPMIVKPMPISPSSTFNLPSFSDSEQQQSTPIVSPRTFSDTIELSTYLHDLTGKSLYSNNIITSDEFEAIQGLGEFYTKPIIRETFMNQQPTHYSVTALLSNHSPRTTLSAFRQYNIPTAHESFIRHC